MLYGEQDLVAVKLPQTILASIYFRLGLFAPHTPFPKVLDAGCLVCFFRQTWPEEQRRS
jgi:hypothetical protein